MIEEFHVDGKYYSDNKKQLKELLKYYKLKWKGTIHNPIWISETESLQAVFIREDDKTIEASLKWNGETPSLFLKSLKDWIGDNIIKPQKEPIIWEKPNPERLRSKGCPESWITKIMEE